MTTMKSKIEEFLTRNGMSDSVKREMLEILNESLLEISRGIMNESKVNKVNKVKVEKCPSTDESNKRYKSKKAEEYAEEHGLTLEDFDINEISKKDVETKVREMTKNKKEITTTSKTNSDEGSSSKNNKSEIKREKVICSGINKKEKHVNQ